jgi:hypothetical protein
VSSDTPLITGRQAFSEELKVTYGVLELKSPRVVNLQFVSRGRRDISPEAFNGKPVCLDLGTHIVECVKVTTSPSDRPDPEWTLEDSKLLIEPSLFGMRQKTVFSLLVDGESPRIVPPKQSMLDVRIERGDEERRMLVGPYIVTAVVLAMLAAAGDKFLSGQPWLSALSVLVGSLVVFGLLYLYLPRLLR